MNKVREKFVRTVEQVEGVDASNYKKSRLKKVAGVVSKSTLPYSKGME